MATRRTGEKMASIGMTPMVVDSPARLAAGFQARPRSTVRSMARRPWSFRVAMRASSVEDLDLGRARDVAGGDRTGAASVEAQHDGSSDSLVSTTSLRFKMMSVTSSMSTGDGVELMERIVEAHRHDGGAGDRREQRPPKRGAEGVAEAGLERADGELAAGGLTIVELLNCGSLNHQHVSLASLSARLATRQGARRGWG